MSQVNVQDILDQLTRDEFTGYQIWKVLSEVRKANGQDEGRPQMVYNYLRNGLIVPKQKIFGATLRPITKLEVAEFLAKYMTKHNLTLKVQSNPDQLELPFETIETVA